MTAKRRDVPPPHPGETLRLAIAQTRLAKAHVARFTGISRKHLYEIMDEKQGITARVAVRLGKFFGTGPRRWLELQLEYDLWLAENEVDVAAIPTFQLTSSG